MRLWLDNTGFHAVGRCLEGRATSDVDVAGLLQFATQVAFSESLSLNGFELPQVLARSQAIREAVLSSVGLEPSWITISQPGEEVFRAACLSAAQRATFAIRSLSSIDAVNLTSIAPDLGRDIVKSLKHFHSVVMSAQSFEQAGTLATNALEMKSGGATSYMLATHLPLFDAVHHLRTVHDSWDICHSSAVNIILRMYLLGELAHYHGHSYSPAVPRAAALRVHSYNMLRVLGNAVDSVIRDRCEGSDLPVPSIAMALVVRGRGEARGILEEAVKLREASKSVRELFRRLVDAYSLDDPRYYQDLESAHNEIVSTLRRELGFEARPTLTSALSLSFTLGIPSITISGEQFMKWYRHKRNAKHMAVLTDLSRESIMNIEHSGELCRLKENVLRHKR